MGFWDELAYATIMVWWDELTCAAVDGFIYVSFTIIYINICILVHAPAGRPASQPERRPASLRERHAAACRHQAPASGMHAASGQPDRAGRPATCSQRPGAGQWLAASGQGMRQRHAVRKKRPGAKTPNHVTNTCISSRKLIKGSPNLIIAMSQRLESYYSKFDVRNPIITNKAQRLEFYYSKFLPCAWQSELNV
jgi:hypothetical protein